ncbi:MAG: YihY/virulence factor BrkB family protein [Actinomycetota bacterium]|nr:YihY/virulence factor BrkB family protein [Actinomycetota bacterium]
MEAIKKPLVQARLKVERARADHGWFDVAYRTFTRYGEDNGPTYAAALTYFTFFSIFPMLLFATAALGYITFGNERLQEDLIESGLKTVPLLRDALRPEGLEEIMKRKGTIALTAVGLALYTGTGAIVALTRGLNQINHVEKERTFAQKRLRSVLWLMTLGLAAVASLGLGIVTRFVPGVLAAILGAIGGIAVNTGLFATAFKFLTARAQSWSDVAVGALVAGVAFEVLKLVGSWFLSRGAGTRSATFGIFAGAAALLIASYLIAQITLLSAEVNAVLAERRMARQSSGTEGGKT